MNNPLIALRSAIMNRDTIQRASRKSTTVSIGGTTLITRTKFSNNFFTGLPVPTVYSIQFTPITPYLGEPTIFVQSTVSLQDASQQFSERMFEHTNKTERNAWGYYG